MSLSPNSSLVRRTIDLNYANKQRSTSLKWIVINGALGLLLIYDLWYKCPGYTTWLHYAQAGACAALAAAAVAHLRRLRWRSGPPRELSTRQQRLLGLKDEDLDSSFHVTPDSPPRAAPPSAEEPASLSPPREWRGGSASPGASPGPAPAPPVAVRDEFIADRRALHKYLRQQEEETEARTGGAGAVWPHYAPPGPGPAPHQLSPLAAGAPSRAEEAAAPGAGLWRRLHVDPRQLAQLELNLRRWLHATVLARLARELDAVDGALAAARQEARLGAAAPERLAALAVAAPALARRLRALLPFLRVAADQRYLVARVRELARGGCLAAYRWDGGGAGWDAARPPDAELLLALLAAYLDGVVPGGAFSATHLSAAPAPVPRGPAVLALHRAARAPPHYVVALGEEAVEVSRGRHNLTHSLLLFVAAAARREPPALCRLHLGPAGLNMLWVLGR